MTDTTHEADDFNTEGVYIPKSYRFERDMDTTEKAKRHDTLQFEEDSNIHFVYEDAKSLVDTEEGLETLAQMLRVFFHYQKPRIQTLEAYSRGENETILSGQRRLDRNKADYRIRHNYGGYISSFVTGFIMGKPITVGSAQEGSDDMEDLEKIHFNNDIDALNYDLGYDSSRFGRAYELHLYDENKQERIYLIDPQEMFVIRSADVTKQMIAAVHCPIYNDRVELTIYLDDFYVAFEPFKPEAIQFEEKERKDHSYGMVPVVEWWNNRFRTGDFEPVITEIDAYDAAQSDTANYMSDLNDALLVISGNIKAAGLTTQDIVDMKDANVMVLESAIGADGKESKLTAGYIYKQYDVQGTEAYKNRLLDDIFRLSNVPNLDDEKFNTSTGIALQYKLVGLRQIQATKENYYRKALRRRYRLIENLNRSLHNTEIEADKLTFTFHPNLPQNVWEEVEKFINAGGEMSQETLRELATFTDNAKELERLAKEAKEEAKRLAEQTPPRRPIEGGEVDGATD